MNGQVSNETEVSRLISFSESFNSTGVTSIPNEHKGCVELLYVIGVIQNKKINNEFVEELKKQNTYHVSIQNLYILEKLNSLLPTIYKNIIRNYLLTEKIDAPSSHDLSIILSLYLLLGWAKSEIDGSWKITHFELALKILQNPPVQGTKYNPTTRYLYVEDNYDLIYKIAWLKIKLKNCNLINKTEIEDGFKKHANFKISKKLGHKEVVKQLSQINPDQDSNNIIIGLLDFDDAYTDIDTQKKIITQSNWQIKEDSVNIGVLYQRKPQYHNHFLLFLPVPKNRLDYVNHQEKIYKLDVEHLFRDEILKSPINKNKFWEELINLPVDVKYPICEDRFASLSRHKLTVAF